MTRLAKPSPDPWEVQPLQYDHGASLAIVSKPTGYIVAIVPFDEYFQTDDEPNADTVKRHACEIPNANVLAAAPKLLDVLEGILPQYSAYVDNEADKDIQERGEAWQSTA